VKFTRDDIRRQFDPGTFSRGEDYARQGRVVSIDIEYPDTLHGKVEGSGRQTYRQEIRVTNDKRGVRFSGACSCPMTRNCKHVVAVLLTDVDHRPVDVPAAAERWLQRLADIQDALQEAEAAARDNAIQLAYVLVPQRERAMPGLHPYTLRLKNDGSIAEAMP
jgi:uncharacterized Zn finger protein